MDVIVSSFVLAAVSEMGDKTQILAFCLASRFRNAWLVLLGILAATIPNHALASVLGAWLALRMPHRLLAGILAVLFVVFGLWTLKPQAAGEPAQTHRLGAFFSTVLLFFLSEMGDKTQLATVALAAHYHSVVRVTIGTTLGMLSSDALAVFAGDRFASSGSLKAARWVAAALFFFFGGASLLAAIR